LPSLWGNLQDGFGVIVFEVPKQSFATVRLWPQLLTTSKPTAVPLRSSLGPQTAAVSEPREQTFATKVLQTQLTVCAKCRKSTTVAQGLVMPAWHQVPTNGCWSRLEPALPGLPGPEAAAGAMLADQRVWLTFRTPIVDVRALPVGAK